MDITLVGAGRLATNLGGALQEVGHRVVQVWSRTETSAMALANRLGCLWTTDIERILPADIVVLSIKDDALAPMARSLQQALDKTAPLVVHTAGSVAMDILPMARRGVFYPMQTFSKQRLASFDEIPLFVEAATEDDTRLLELLANSISRRVYRLSSEERKYLHLAAVFACNFSNHCYALSADILQAHGIPFEVMLPLIDQTAQKVHDLSPLEAQTGPAVRYDRLVIDSQERLLDGLPKEIYRTMSQSIHQSGKAL
ncbi:MAG: DUF2520 domain-containing protein [Bacteroidaceae bacterium]|nr:DUF2520 domain-containing protein [Bacteroidaceae bacterium]